MKFILPSNLFVILLSLTPSSNNLFALAKEEEECEVSADGSSTCKSKSATTSNEPECGIYMAPSTLGDKTNNGMYTSKPVKKGSELNYPEIAIPFRFRDFGAHPPHAYKDGELWDRYIWNGWIGNLEVSDPIERTSLGSVFVPGLGCTVNSILELHNIDSTHGSKYDTAGVPRSDPNAGSFTPYHYAVTSASMDIPAGSELFASYGDHWIPWIPDVAITMEDNLLDANDFLEDYKAFAIELNLKYGKEEGVDAALLDKLYKKLIRGFPHKKPPFSVLPFELDHEGILKDEKDVIPDTHNYWRERGVVDVDWLKANGRCQDHMRPDISTIPNAGRGAFATRDLPKGTIVGYAPLVHIGERAVDTMTVNYTNTYYDFGDKKQHDYSKMDLIINYSFGHKDSTMILSPYGAMVNFINHSKEKANVRLQWPKEELVAHIPDWLDKSLEAMRDTNKKIGLSFDYVALRDIKEGEEIFLDYGDEWQKAYDEHVKNWKPPKDAKSYKHMSQYFDVTDTEPRGETPATNKARKDFILKTPKEQKKDPYPPNLETLCRESYNLGKDGKYHFIHVLRNVNARVECEVIDRYEKPTSDDDQQDNGSLGKKYLYTVKMKIPSKDDGSIPDDDIDDSRAKKFEEITVYDVPYLQGIDLYDKVYSQDWHLPQAFRHKMYIPDDIFPEQWKNLK